MAQFGRIGLPILLLGGLQRKPRTGLTWSGVFDDQRRTDVLTFYQASSTY